MFCFLNQILISRSRGHIRVVAQISSRNRIDVEALVNRGTCRYTTLEIPNVFATSKEVETNQVAATTSFHIEFASPLINQHIQIDRCDRCGMCTIAQHVDIVYYLLIVTTQTVLSLSTCEVHLSQTEQRNISIRESSITGRAVVRTTVLPLHD